MSETQYKQTLLLTKAQVSDLFCARHLAQRYFQAFDMPRKSNIFLKFGPYDMEFL